MKIEDRILPDIHRLIRIGLDDMEIEAMNARSISSRLPLQVKLLAVSVAALVTATGLVFL